jgi:hypothetical protein
MLQRLFIISLLVTLSSAGAALLHSHGLTASSLRPRSVQSIVFPPQITIGFGEEDPICSKVLEYFASDILNNSNIIEFTWSQLDNVV